MCAEQIVAAAPTATQLSLRRERSQGFISRSGFASTAPPTSVWKFSRTFFIATDRRQRSPRRRCAMNKDLFKRLHLRQATSTSGCDDDPAAIKLTLLHLRFRTCVATPSLPRAINPLPSAGQNRGGDGCPSGSSLQCRRHSTGTLMLEVAIHCQGNSAAGHSKGGSAVT